MQINSTNRNPMLSQTFNTAGKGCAQNSEAEVRELDNEIQSLQQKKANLSKEIESIKGDFAPPKPKEQLIRPLKDEIQAINAKIQEKQAEKVKKQADNIQETSNSDESKKSSLSKQNIEGRSISDSDAGKSKTALEQSKSLITQTGVINEGKVKTSLKDSSEHMNSINDKRVNWYVKSAINQYNLIENADFKNPASGRLA